jgi:hypothetical protein
MPESRRPLPARLPMDCWTQPFALPPTLVGHACQRIFRQHQGRPRLAVGNQDQSGLAFRSGRLSHAAGMQDCQGQQDDPKRVPSRCHDVFPSQHVRAFQETGPAALATVSIILPPCDKGLHKPCRISAIAGHLPHIAADAERHVKILSLDRSLVGTPTFNATMSGVERPHCARKQIDAIDCGHYGELRLCRKTSPISSIAVVGYLLRDQPRLAMLSARANGSKNRLPRNSPHIR